MATMDRTNAEVSGWAFGFAAFAGAIMLMIGIFQAFAGLAAILNDEFFVVGNNYTYDLGVSVYAGATWARAVGIVLAILSAVANFFFIPYYPVWSVLIIALCIAVIWALTVYNRDAALGRG